MTRILAVEDSPTQAEKVRLTLEGEGFEVETALDGQEGREKLEASNFDLVVSDVLMPRLSGYELCRWMKSDARTKEIPVILLTALNDPMDIIQALEAGADNFISKPYEPDYLVARVRNVLESTRLRVKGEFSVNVEMIFMGRRFTIGSGKQQILALLLSAFEDMVRTNHELRATQAELTATKEKLEEYALKLEGRVQASEEMYATLMRQASDAIVLFDEEGVVLEANLKAAALVGRPVSEIVGRRATDFITAAQRAGVRYLLDDLAAERSVRPMDFVVERPDGSTVETEASMSRVEVQGRKVIFGLLRDVTEKRQAAEALRESEAELKEAQRVAHVGSWSWVVETNTVTWSEEIFRIAGRDPTGRAPNYSREHLMLYTPESLARLQPLVERAIRTGEPYEVDLEVIRPDGTTRWIAAIAEVRRDAKGQIVGLRGTSEDITEQRRLQAQLLHAQKMEAVGRLAGGVAHDFNNILTVIGGYNEMLTKALPVGEPAHQQATEIGLAARRAAALTRQLLTFSRKQVLELKVLDVNTIVNGILELLSRLLGEDVEIVLKLQKGLGLVKADPGQIEQVIMNLAVNARDAMPHGGKLILETQDVDLDESYQRTHPSVVAGPYVLLAASDTGCGMTPETMSHIFEPFFTTKAVGKGTGLGLSTTFGIVKQSGGDVGVYSVPGEGSTFKIYLPRMSSGTGEHDLAWSPTIIRARTGETVLMVEDDEAVGRLTQSMLGDLGYEVLAAARGEEALEIAAHHPHPIDLLLTDMLMPGMRGPEVASRLLALRPETRVVFMSGYAEELVLNHAAVQGTAVFLQKPFTSSSLGTKLREALDAAPLPGQQGAGVHGGRKPLSILHMDDDRDILEITRFFLAEDGHRVVGCFDVEETVARYAEALARGERFDLVILDLSIPGKKGGVEGMREILKLDPTAKIVACSGAGPAEVGPLESGFVGIVEKPFTSKSLKAILALE
jgi:two-component system cell cycle sensor histidine kinase/response regulator CckA